MADLVLSLQNQSKFVALPDEAYDLSDYVGVQMARIALSLK